MSTQPPTENNANTRKIMKPGMKELSKALHYVRSAKAQFDLSATESKAKFDQKVFLGNLAERCWMIEQRVLENIKGKDAEEQRRNMETIMKDLRQDEFRIDAIITIFLQLNAQGQDYAEQIINGLFEGKMYAEMMPDQVNELCTPSAK